MEGYASSVGHVNAALKTRVDTSVLNVARSSLQAWHAAPILALYYRSGGRCRALRRRHGRGDAYVALRDAELRRAHERAAPRLAAMVEALGCGYIKFSQFLLSQGAAIPAAWVRELGFAYERVAPRPWAEVEPWIAEAVDMASFQNFERAPLAAASVGQVHRATVVAGAPRGGGRGGLFNDVAVKVLYGEVAAVFPLDAANLSDLATFANDLLDVGAYELLRAVLDCFEESFPLELDLRNECRNMERAAALFGARGFGDVVVPTAVGSLTSKHVLTCEFLDGVTVAALPDVEADEAPMSNGDDVVEVSRVEPRACLGAVVRAVDAIGATMFLDGFFHADPRVPRRLRYVRPARARDVGTRATS